MLYAISLFSRLIVSLPARLPACMFERLPTCKSVCLLAFLSRPTCQPASNSMFDRLIAYLFYLPPSLPNRLSVCISDIPVR